MRAKLRSRAGVRAASRENSGRTKSAAAWLPSLAFWISLQFLAPSVGQGCEFESDGGGAPASEAAMKEEKSKRRRRRRGGGRKEEDKSASFR